MSFASEHPTGCRQPRCTKTVPASRHDKIRAQQEGWFFPRDDNPDGWCPEHKPEWVDAWRARRDAS